MDLAYWTQAYSKYTDSTGNNFILRGLNLATLVMHGIQAYIPQE